MSSVINPAYCPSIHRDVIAARLEIGRMVFSELGLEKRCTCCLEFFPADTEFFAPKPKSRDGLSTQCKVCQYGKGNQ